MKTVFSIIIPVYNVEGYLRKCLDSLVAQTCADWEAICVDDGSTDGSGAILDEYAKKDGRFKVLHQENRGVSAARNAALDLAQGEWIMFADADDVVHRNELKRVLEVAEAHPEVDAVGFRLVRFVDGEIPSWSSDNNASVLDVGAEIPDCLFGIAQPTIALKRNVFGDIRFKDFPLGEDWIYLSECYVRARRIAFLKDQLYGYRQRTESAVHLDMTAERMARFIPYFEEMYRVLDSSGKKIGKAFSRTHANGWFENSPRLICQLKKEERPALWKQWFESMEVARRMKCFSPWQHFVALVMSCSRSAAAARLLCVLPFRLKKMGLHR